MPRIMVISAGPGDAAAMTLAAKQALDDAQMVFLAPRHSELVPPAKRCALQPFSQALDGIDAAFKSGIRIAVLVSGDAGLYSFLPLLKRRFGEDALTVIAGVSALQTLCAKLCIPWSDSRILSVHGRELSRSALAHAVQTHERTFLYCDAEHGVSWACETLIEAGLTQVEVCAGQWLSYPNERIVRGTPAELLHLEHDALSVAVLINPASVRGLPPVGIADDAFQRGDTPMTKREIRALAIEAMALSLDDVVWDIGAGTGSVSVECARQCPCGRVFAIEREAEAIALLRKNMEQFRLQNVEIIHGNAPEALRNLPVPARVFLGGNGGQAEAIITYLESLKTPLRLVATAVTLENSSTMIRRLESWKRLEAAQVAVQRLKHVGNYHLFNAQNPVIIITADWEPL